MTYSGVRNWRRDAYIVACGRVMTDVMGVVRSQGLAVGIDIDPGHFPFHAITGPHKIQITYGRARRIVAVDHDRFMSAEHFRASVLHQVKAAIEELANVQKAEPGVHRGALFG